MSSAKHYFVTGTDTDVGKTIATVQLIRAFVLAGYKTMGMKPIASGCELHNGIPINADVSAHQAASNVQAKLELISPYRFLPAISPHLAAAEAGVEISIQHILECEQQLQQIADVVIIEGAGGWLAPISDTQRIADLAQALQAPVIVVVGMRLGCLNHALLTVNAIEQSGLQIAGWIANRIDPQFARYDENLLHLKQHIKAPFLAEIEFSADADKKTLHNAAIAQIACS